MRQASRGLRPAARASWIGGQEALHDEVLTVDDALERIDHVTAADILRVAGSLIRADALRLAVVAPKGYGAGLDERLRLSEVVA